MAEIPQSTFATIIAVVLTIIPFFATSALDRVDELESKGIQGHIKFASLITLFFAYFTAIVIASAIFFVWGEIQPGLLLTALYTIFIALYLPSIVLMIPKIMEAHDLWRDPNLEVRYQIIAILLIGGMLSLLLRNSPA